MNYPHDPRQGQHGQGHQGQYPDQHGQYHDPNAYYAQQGQHQGHPGHHAGAQMAAQSPWAQQMQAMGGVMPVAAQSQDTRVAFLKKVYTWFCVGLATTAASAAAGYFVIDALLANAREVGNVGDVSSGIFGWGWIAAIVIWMVSSFIFHKMLHNPTSAKVALFGYNGIFGIVLSFLLYIAVASTGGVGIVWTALLLTGLTFGGLTLYVLTTKADFSWLRGALVVGSMIAIGLVLVSILSFALGWELFDFGSIWGLIIPGFFVLLMAGFTLYDTSKIMREYPEHLYVAAGAQLSIDFGMMFYYILMILLSLVGRE